MGIKLGIGIITYNRSNILKETIKSIQKYTKTEFSLIVADDGSSDDTCSVLTEMGIPFITGRNKGISWNRNRALWYLKEVCSCNQIIIFEDDCFPNQDGWEDEWIKAINYYGHVNYMPDLTIEIDNDISSGSGTAKDPFIAPMHQAFCVGYHRKALEYVGYLDTRFIRYGEEHVEHTHRFLRAGYGGLLQKHRPERGQLYYLSGGLDVFPSESHGDHSIALLNKEIHDAIQYDVIYRSPWKTDYEMFEFRYEIERKYVDSFPISQLKNKVFDSIVFLGSDKELLQALLNISHCPVLNLFPSMILPFHTLISQIQKDFADIHEPSCLYAYHDNLRCRDTLIVYDDFYNKEDKVFPLVEDYRAYQALMKIHFLEKIEILKTWERKGNNILFIRDWNDASHYENWIRPSHSSIPNFSELKSAISLKFPDCKPDFLFINFGDVRNEDQNLFFANSDSLFGLDEKDKIITYMKMLSKII
ncbi:MAG: glycosyltransferase family 2 protein [Acetobacter sp.]|nr:glycosyltransferase family 2 protein [Acetobacter sp.]